MKLPADYKVLSAFQDAVGSLGLDAAEAYFQAAKKTFFTPVEAIDFLTLDLSRKHINAVIGLTGALIINKLKDNKSDIQSSALRDWATQVYRKMQVDVAVGTLKEYKKWKTNPCTYSAPGYQKPDDCHDPKNPYNQMWKTAKPPADILSKAGLQYASGDNDLVVRALSGALAGIGVLAAFGAGATGIGVATAFISVKTACPY
jgi:hypothetical protein